jgi:hypothetical protein
VFISVDLCGSKLISFADGTCSRRRQNKILSRCAAGFYGCKLGIISGVGKFSRHARAGGHPAFSGKRFWIPACAGMTTFESENSTTSELIV